MVSTAIKFSKYQTALFNAIEDTTDNIIVSAVAGSGKSFSLIEACKRINSNSVLFCAFNKHIADELSRKLGNMATVKTIHSLGNSALYKHLGKTKIDNHKYYELAKEQASEALQGAPWAKIQELTSVLSDLNKFSQCALVDPSNVDDLEDLAFHFGVNTNGFDFEMLADCVQRIQTKGQELAKRKKLIDFIDMIWLPVVWDLAMNTYEWVLADEVQDFSKVQVEIVRKSLAKNGRLIAVGDPRQAVYMFSGADCDSFKNVKSAFNCKEYPLSICYRCPTSHLDLARSIVPPIEARPEAPIGEVVTIKTHNLALMAQKGDYIICRLTAPLVKACISLIKNKIPAKVLGRNIGTDLGKIISDVEKINSYTWKEFPIYLEEYKNQKLDRISKRKNAEAKMEMIRDQIDGIFACYESYDCDSATELRKSIENLFSDSESTVTLATVHRTKGLEADRVFILKPEKMPLVWKGQLGSEFEQELNLKYVALTRSKNFLAFVED